MKRKRDSAVIRGKYYNIFKCFI